MKRDKRNMKTRVVVMAVATLFAVSLAGSTASAHDPGEVGGPVSIDTIKHLLVEDRQPAKDMGVNTSERCKNGMAGPFPCKNVDLASYMPLKDFGSESGNDIWGWTDPVTDKEYALMGLDDGTGFVDVTNPKRPVYLGKLPTQSEPSPWRDIKVYDNHAYIVSEAEGHGMQVFDLTRLREAREPRTWSVDAQYDEFGGSHNVAINENSGFAYSVGTGTCQGGLHMIDLSTPKEPTFAGCFATDGYTHDTQVVNYQGPDEDYQGREIAFSSNEDTVTITDVTDKSNPTLINRINYVGSAYTHQGWLTPDQRHFLLGDELDEFALGHNTRTRIFDMKDLDAPVNMPDVHDASTGAIDHNIYTKGELVHQANYRAGYRVLDAGSVADGKLREVGFFDVYPKDDQNEFNGAWSNYPYFDSGTVVVSGIEQGLFVLRPRDEAKPQGI